MHEKQVTINDDMDYMEILDAAAQQGVGEESGSDSGKLWNALNVFKKCVQWWRELCVPKMREFRTGTTGHAGGNNAVFFKTA